VFLSYLILYGWRRAASARCRAHRRCAGFEEDWCDDGDGDQKRWVSKDSLLVIRNRWPETWLDRRDCHCAKKGENLRTWYYPSLSRYSFPTRPRLHTVDVQKSRTAVPRNVIIFRESGDAEVHFRRQKPHSNWCLAPLHSAVKMPSTRRLARHWGCFRVIRPVQWCIFPRFFFPFIFPKTVIINNIIRLVII